MQKPARQMLSEINVTPFVDVMLVLLVIFMVTAPMMMQGIDVDLPKTQAPAIASGEERLVVTIARDHRVFINEYPVEINVLGPKLAALYQNLQGQHGVFLRADENLAYGAVVEVMGIIRSAGIDEIGLVIEPGGEAAKTASR